MNIFKKLRCPKCGEPYYSNNIRFLECACGFVCDITCSHVKFYNRNKDDRYSSITRKGWGMDLIE